MAAKRKSRGISTGWDPKTGKVGYARSVKPKKPKSANYASGWASSFRTESTKPKARY